MSTICAALGLQIRQRTCTFHYVTAMLFFWAVPGIVGQSRMRVCFPPIERINDGFRCCPSRALVANCPLLACFANMPTPVEETCCQNCAARGRSRLLPRFAAMCPSMCSRQTTSPLCLQQHGRARKPNLPLHLSKQKTRPCQKRSQAPLLRR